MRELQATVGRALEKLARDLCASSGHPALLLTRDIVDVKSSGAEEPAAMNVAPATSSDNCSASLMASSDGTKKSSHTMAMPRNM